MQRIFSDEELAAFRTDGYIVLHHAVPDEQCDAVVQAMWEFLGQDPNDPNTWYPPQRQGSMVYLHQHPAMWTNRQTPRVHQAFSELLGTEKLWVSMDRCGMKPPISPKFPQHEDRGFIHWDMEISPDKPVSGGLHVQGVLALSDTTPEMGGFRCVPGFCTPEIIEEWKASVPPEKVTRNPDLSTLPPGYEVQPIPMKKGDLLIWHRLLLHGNGRNEGTRPRLAQYITMHRAPSNAEGDEKSDHSRAERVASWQEKRAPANWEDAIPDFYKGRETNNPVAELSPLGRKLLGTDSWDD